MEGVDENNNDVDDGDDKQEVGKGANDFSEFFIFIPNEFLRGTIVVIIVFYLKLHRGCWLG